MLFLPKKIKIEKVEKLVANLHGKTEYFIHIRTLKPTLNRGLVFKKVYRMIKLNQKACLKPNINMNTVLRNKAKTDCEKVFLS